MEPLTLITEIKPLLPARLAGEQHQRPPFSQGQLLHGVISAKGDANRFTLEINGQPITAESSAPLRVGQRLDLQVISLTPRMELQIVGSDPVNRWLGNVLPLLNQQSSLLPEVTALAGDSRLMAQLSATAQETLRFYAGDAAGTSSGAPEGAEPKLEQYLNRLGLDLERLLADNKPEEASRTLKFALLELSQQIRMTGESAVVSDRLVHTLDMLQLLQIRLANESFLFLPLPFPFLQQGYLLVENDRFGKHSETTRGQADREDQTVELHLQLEGLGNMQIDIRRQEDRITLRFLTETAEKAKFVAAFREELEQRIASGNLESVQFLVGAREPVRTLLEKFLPSGAGMIDTKA